MPEKMLAAFAQALERFRQALETDAESDLLRAGCIQYFEFCFELAWKSIKVVAGRAGQLDCLSPRAALKQAFANRWIDEEEIWLDMLESRNLMAHTYSAEAALQIYRHLAGYLPEMERLLQVLEKELLKQRSDITAAQLSTPPAAPHPVGLRPTTLPHGLH